MGKFVMGLLIGLVVGLAFADVIFPAGFNAAVEQWGEQVRREIPGR
jgi:hypothetical protein